MKSINSRNKIIASLMLPVLLSMTAMVADAADNSNGRMTSKEFREYCKMSGGVVRDGRKCIYPNGDKIVCDPTFLSCKRIAALNRGNDSVVDITIPAANSQN